MRLTRPPLIALCLVWLPACFVLITAAVVCLPLYCPLPWWSSVLIAVAWWYMAPPLLTRFLFLIGGRPLGSFPFASRQGLLWFTALQLQLPFQRLAFTEEILRLIPGLYQMWLRLWGSRVALTSVWSPGVVVADRWGLDVGPRAVIGARAHIGAHVMVKHEDSVQLTVAPVRVGADAIVGALCAVGPGAVIAPGAMLNATRPLPPFSQLNADGTRKKKESEYA